MEKDTIREMQEVNKRLSSSMKAFQIAAEMSGNLVFTYDTKQQSIFVDEHTAAAFGISVEQKGVPYEMVELGVVSPDTAAEYIRIHEAMIAGKAEAGGIVKLIQADGTESIQELKFRAILDEDGCSTGTAVGVYYNITDSYLRDVEQECYRQMVYASEHFTFCYDIAKDIYTIFVPSGGTHNEEIRYYYENFLSRLETGEFCPGEDVAILKEILTQGSKKPVQVQFFHKNTKELVWYSVTATRVKNAGTAGQVIGLIYDISYLKQQEEARHKLERVLQTIKDDYIGIFEIDLEQDRYSTLHYTEHAQQIFPVLEHGRFSEFVQRMRQDLVSKEFQEPFSRFADRSSLQKSLSRNHRLEWEYMTSLHNNPWRRITFQVSEFKDGVPALAIMYQTDIDQLKAERLHQQQVIKEAYQYAESANAAKTDFLSRMSHDIRTPMNAIVGMTAIAGMDLEDPVRVKDCLNKINAASRHLLNLINEVLDMNKIEAGAIELQEEEFNLADLIDNMITMIMPQIHDHNHTLRVSVNDLKHEWVVGDSLRIQQVFVNLISNAVKYTPDGGKISVSIQERPSHSQNYGEYEFCFEDNGIGMSEEFLQVLFEPFARAEDSRLSKVTGTGLGMTITKNLIRMMDGSIKVDSRLGQGSRFIVTIHLKIQENSEKLPEGLLGRPVLVVDDDKTACISTCILLGDIGMQGEWCLSSKEALARIQERRNRGNDYFAVILDWKMPEMDGLTAARSIRELVGPDMPIFILTACDWSAIEADARTAGVTKCLSKPLFKSRLLASFRELVIQPEIKEEETLFSEDIAFHDRRVLVAEDNDINAEIAVELLRMTGLEAERAQDGSQAVSMVEHAPEGYYDLIFMDIQMPILDGYGAATAIRSLDRRDVKRIPIVAMTANAFAEDVNHAIRSGMNEHIAKPIDIARLQSVLEKYLS